MGEVIHRDNASVIVHCSHGRERGVVYVANDVHVGTPELGKLGADHAAMAGDDNPLADVFCGDTFDRGVHPITKRLGTIAIDVGVPALGPRGFVEDCPDLVVGQIVLERLVLINLAP